MASKKGAKDKAKTKKLVFLKPKLLVVAVICAAGAMQEPPVFTAATIGVWVAGALTAGLLAAAALALALPAARLLAGIGRDTIIALQKGDTDK
jgi:hypothetical protein